MICDPRLETCDFGWTRRLRALLASALALLTPTALAWAATGRAVSLNALAEASKSGRSSEVTRLCGITEARGFLLDETNRDVVVVGKVDPSLPPLQLDDFVVALRNVWAVYARVQGRTRYYSAPGCSIDPDPEVLRELKRIGDRMHTGGPGNDMETILSDWNDAGRRPQNVRVMGVPFDTRFAKVMVDADYYMKRLVNGSIALGIPGFESLSDLKANEAREELTSGRVLSKPGQSLNRFWFSPGETTYDEDDGVISLRSCRVRLLTEEEFLTAHGRVAGMGRPDALAGRFAQSFGAHYDEIAAARPVYKELQGLFRFVALARMMKDNRAGCRGLDYLLKSHRLAVSPVSRQVLGLVNVKRVNEETDSSSGKATLSIVMPSCGGVSMDVRPKKIVKASPPTPAKRAGPSSPAKSAKRPASALPASAAPVRRPSPLKKAILSARKSPRAISWDFPLDK